MSHGAVDLLTVPLDLGAGLTPGLRALGLRVRDHGFIPVAAPETREHGDTRMRFGRQIVHVCTRLRDRVGAMLREGGTPLILGGDHSIAMGTVAGVSGHLHERGDRLGLLWIDAHADLNTPSTTPSGNVHGMPLAAITGHCDAELDRIGTRTPMVDIGHAALVGVRDVDPGEAERIRALGLGVWSMKEIDERGIRVCLREAMERVTEGTAGFHLSFDMDSIDPETAPGVGTPVPGGLTYREAHLACELAHETKRLLSMELVEVNPILDQRNRSAWLAVELILSALGKRIL